MNKRLKKKKEKEKSLVTVKDISNKTVHVYINKKHWNKGDKSKGFMIIDDANDYITLEQVAKERCQYIANFLNVRECYIHFHKSIDNRNYIKTMPL